MGVSGAMIGLNTAVSGAACIAVVPFVPRLAARLGVLPLLWLAIAVAIASFLGFKLLFDSCWWFPLRFAVRGGARGPVRPSEFWINAAAPPASARPRHGHLRHRPGARLRDRPGGAESRRHERLAALSRGRRPLSWPASAAPGGAGPLPGARTAGPRASVLSFILRGPDRDARGAGVRRGRDRRLRAPARLRPAARLRAETRGRSWSACWRSATWRSRSRSASLADRIDRRVVLLAAGARRNRRARR